MSLSNPSPAYVEYLFGPWSLDIPRLPIDLPKKTRLSPCPSMMLQPHLQGLLQFNLRPPTESVSTASFLAKGLADSLISQARNTTLLNPNFFQHYPLTDPCGCSDSLLHSSWGGSLPPEQWPRNDESIDAYDNSATSTLGTQLQIELNGVLDDVLGDINNEIPPLTPVDIEINRDICHVPCLCIAEPKEVTFPEERHKHCKLKEKKHKCPVCGERLATHKKLRVHARLHILQQAYMCPICDKMFVKRNTMNMHMRVHIT